MRSKTFSCEVGGKEMVAEFSDLAEQANGSVILRYGETTVLATAVMSAKTRDELDYFPLTVDYEERFYAAGQILGSRFVRREGRPSEEAILTGRVVDRTIRPLFPQHIRNEVQVVVTILALGDEDPDTVAVNAASLALGVSDIPWAGPVAAVRIGKNGEAKKALSEASPNQLAAGESTFFAQPDFIVNPTYAERDGMRLDLLACGKDGTINMVEVGAREASEDDVAAAFARASDEHGALVAWQKGIIAELGKQKRFSAERPALPDGLAQLFEAEFAQKVSDAVFCGVAGKDAIHALQDEWMKRVQGDALTHGSQGVAFDTGIATRLFEDKVDEEIHRGAVEDGTRADARGFAEIRPLFAKAGGVSLVLHGSGIFYRGGTHVFTALTLGGPGDSLVVDSMEDHDVKKRFMHHYNFPPYSSGETGRMGGANRRAVGHGALAEKALLPVIPAMERFPYTVRVVSECFASNGSTSMGSVCASTLALMDGGVPISAPVAGIAMGLMLSPARSENQNPKYKILTDIQGPEDEYGDMDFKVAGTRSGITAIQLDIKLDGVPVPILVEALAGARAARMQILDIMEREIAAPRQQISPRAPEIITMRVRPDQIGLVIGGGGKTINGIKESAGVVDITIEDDGGIYITGTNGTAAKAKEMIEAVVKEYKAGEVYEGTVSRLMDFGAFVKIGPSKDAEGLVHVSEVAPFRIDKIASAVAVGDKVRVMIKEIDEKGRLNLSIKAADPDFASRKGLVPSTNGGFGQNTNRSGNHGA